MRDHLEILNEIDMLLAEKGYDNECEELAFEINASVTGGEVCARSIAKLITLRNENEAVASVIGPLLKELLSYYRANGIYPKPALETM